MNRSSVQLDWSIEGLQFALDHNNIVVIVDTLRFSSAVVTAVSNGFTLYPVSDQQRGTQLAESIGAEMSGKPGQARYSLSPLSYLNTDDGCNKEVVLFSPNGAACAELVRKHDTAYIGCLLNAKAVGQYISRQAQQTHQNVTVIAAGEQRSIDTGEKIVYIQKNARRVFAVEDYLGCGAIFCYTDLSKTAEAEVCALAYEASQSRLLDILCKSFSGQYLIQHNLSGDIEHAGQVNRYDIVPAIRDGKIECHGRGRFQ